MGTATLEVKLPQQVAATREAVLHAILLDLNKVCDALDRSRCLDILEGYGLGPRALCLLFRYWKRLQMVVRTGGYYGETFRGERDVTQREPLPPTIFNVVVDVVVRHWEFLVAERAAGGTAATTTAMRSSRRGGQSGKRTTDDGGWRRSMHG